MKKILITSPLPCADGELHFGHLAAAYLPSDCYARFQRLMGNDVLFVCGSDDHGKGITSSAESGRQHKKRTDHNHKVIQAFFHRLEIFFDHTIRTTCPRHIETVQEFFRSMQSKNLVEERTENCLYSPHEKRFLADSEITGGCPRCGCELQEAHFLSFCDVESLPPEDRCAQCHECSASYQIAHLKNPRSRRTGAAVEIEPSKHLYLCLDRMDWGGRRQEPFEKFDLKPRRITKDDEWGIAVPGYPGKVFDGWFSAPVGYISAARDWSHKNRNPDQWKDFWLDTETKLVHFIDQKGLLLHAVLLPALLMGQDLSYKLPDALPSTGQSRFEGRKFSEHWTSNIDAFFSRFTAEEIRYCVAANTPEKADSWFIPKEFQSLCNENLVGKLENFYNKVLTFTCRYFGSEIPPAAELQEADRQFVKEINRLIDSAATHYEEFHLGSVCETLMELAVLGNTYFNEKKPELLAKDPSKRGELETTLSLCIDCLKNLALIASPILPASAQKIWNQLGCADVLAKGSWQAIRGASLPNYQKVSNPAPLFRRVPDDEIEEQIAHLGKVPLETSIAPCEPLNKDQVPFEHFDLLDIRIAQILEAERVPKSQKLLKLKLDLGVEERTVVSSIAQAYEPTQLIGRKVLLVANLEPTTVMGIESQGMLLTARRGSQHEIPEIQKLPPGSIAD